jgi:hypothetical protein
LHEQRERPAPDQAGRLRLSRPSRDFGGRPVVLPNLARQASFSCAKQDHVSQLRMAAQLESGGRTAAEIVVANGGPKSEASGGGGPY